MKIMCEMRIALTNLGKYNEGELIYKWLELPATDEEIKKAFDEIGINERYEEFFITDYECEFYQIGEYENIETLNEIAEALDELDEDEKIIVKALINDGYDLEEALDKKDDCRLWDTTDMADIAEEYYYECYAPNNNVPDFIERYIDFEAMGRDMSFEGHYIEYNNMIIEVY